MDRVKSNELKYLIIFLITVVLSATMIWGSLEFFYRKPPRNLKPIFKASRNLAPQQEEGIEKIPVVGENIETYQFKDPFTPLSKSNAPAENIAPSTGVATGASNGTSTTSTEPGSNTAAGKRAGIQVIKIAIAGNKDKATIRYNGKVIELYENQMVGNYTVIDIDTANNSVDLLNGDEKFTLTLLRS